MYDMTRMDLWLPLLCSHRVSLALAEYLIAKTSLPHLEPLVASYLNCPPEPVLRSLNIHL